MTEEEISVGDTNSWPPTEARHDRGPDGVTRWRVGKQTAGTCRALRSRGASGTAAVEIGEVLSAALPRGDWRRKGMEYVRGLLGASGRKSIRNIAALIGGKGTAQSLHHFITVSNWEWEPVRRALAEYVTSRARPEAWVLRPLTIPKTGGHSVGVDRWFCSRAGQLLNAQQAVGVWAASVERSIPISWRLRLSSAWLGDARRSTASIPDEVGEETLGHCVIEAFLEAATGLEVPALPVVLDAREMDVTQIASGLRAAGAPMLARVSGAQRVLVADSQLTDTGALPAHHVMTAAVTQPRSATCVPIRAETATVSATRVRMPAADGGAHLRLLRIAPHGEHRPAELWLTDLMSTPPATLLRLSRLIDRVDRDVTEVADGVGLRDFSGRSFTGWHHHVTLASAAHAVAILARRRIGEMTNAC